MDSPTAKQAKAVCGQRTPERGWRAGLAQVGGGQAGDGQTETPGEGHVWATLAGWVVRVGPGKMTRLGSQASGSRGSTLQLARPALPPQPASAA